MGEIYQYDQNQNLSKVYATEGIRSYLLDQYNYDENGNITYHKETGFYSGSPKETSYIYDDLNRLKTESVTKNNQTTSNMYAYDGFGNLTSEIRGTRFINYTYNGLNQLINKTDSSAVGMAAFIGVNYSYDIHGNMTSVYDPGSVAGTTFMGSYNVNGQLETSKKNVNKGGLKDIQSTYTYDGLGNPVKEQSRSTYYSKQTNLTTEYIYDYTEEVPTVLSEIRSDGVTIDYTYGDSKERLEAVVTSTSVYNQSEKTYNISTDERGSSRWALDDVGNVKAKTSYDAWGNVTENTAISLSSYMDDINLTESFTGYIYDEGTKAWNAGARTYDPVTKRFLSEDPESGSTQEPISMVKYVYAYNNPVMNIDPDGRSVWGTITSWAGKTASAVKSFVGNTVNKASQAASYVKEKVSQGIENFRQAGREVLDTVAGYMQKVACMIPDGVKKVWHDATKLYEKIPTEAKFAIGFIGGAIAWGTGVAEVGVLVAGATKLMLGGAAINVGTYAAEAFFGYHDFSWKEMGKRAIDGAADASLLFGIGAGSIGLAKSKRVQKFLRDESGGAIDISRFGKKKGIAVETSDNSLCEKLMAKRGIPSSLSPEEIEACRAVDLRMQANGVRNNKFIGEGGSGPLVEIVDKDKGTFIIKDWSDYPDDYVPVPDKNKIWTFLEGDDYTGARDAANTFNRNMRFSDPYYSNNGLEIHEIEPVKMGGSPTDLNNKVAIQSQAHRRYVTPWWNKIRNEVKKGLE